MKKYFEPELNVTTFVPESAITVSVVEPEYNGDGTNTEIIKP